jgi:hypothetical protein
MKNPRNHAKTPRSANCMVRRERKLLDAIRRLKLNGSLMLSGDERDRTANLLVANQIVYRLTPLVAIHLRQRSRTVALLVALEIALKMVSIGLPSSLRVYRRPTVIGSSPFSQRGRACFEHLAIEMKAAKPSSALSNF